MFFAFVDFLMPPIELKVVDKSQCEGSQSESKIFYPQLKTFLQTDEDKILVWQRQSLKE